MKVVLFCGGLGMRMRSGDGSVPKPMMPIGARPVLWHVMRYYAHFGHTDFVLALGHGGRAVKDYFLRYDETESNDFVLSKGGASVEPLRSDISDWTITFVDTGLHSPIGERLRRVRDFVDGEEMFLANYGDVLTDASLPTLVDKVSRSDAVGSVLAVRPRDSFHVMRLRGDGTVAAFTPVGDLSLRINGGYFVLRDRIFDYLNEGEDLVADAFRRAAADRALLAVEYDGFWAPMDTLKERAELESRYHSGDAPWMLWEQQPSARRPPTSGATPILSWSA